jgi:RNA polymerase sigma-70 factor (ECF subfamily)
VTARNLAIDQARRGKRYDRILSELALDALETRLEVHADRLNPRADAMRDCLEQLPDEARRLLTLRYFAGYRGAELAQLLGRRETAIYKALSRLHHQLRDCIDRRLAARPS